MNGFSARVCGCGVIFSSFLAGCETPIATGEQARDRLLKAMHPFGNTLYVSMRGQVRGTGDARPQPMVLLLAPDGKFFYRAGSAGFYSNGKVRGRIDFRPSPPRQSVDSKASRVGDVVGVLRQAAGPVPFAGAYLAAGGDWLEIFGSVGALTFEERMLDFNRTEIRVIGEERTHRFVFSGDPDKPLAYSLHDNDRLTGYLTEFRFESVEFPTSIPDEEFYH